MVDVAADVRTDEFVLYIGTDNFLPATTVGKIISEIGNYVHENYEFAPGDRFELVEVRTGSVWIRFRAVLQDLAAVAGVIGLAVTIAQAMSGGNESLTATARDLMADPNVNEIVIMHKNGDIVVARKEAQTMAPTMTYQPARKTITSTKKNPEKPKNPKPTTPEEWARFLSLKRRNPSIGTEATFRGEFAKAASLYSPSKRGGLFRTEDGNEIHVILSETSSVTEIPHGRSAMISGTIIEIDGAPGIRVSSITLT